MLGCPVSAITNSLIFELKSGKARAPILVLAPGDRRIDTLKLAARLGVSKNKIKSASANSVLAYTGYEAGGVGPFGHIISPEHTFIEERVFNHASCWCGAGVKPAMLQVSPSDLMRGTGALRCKLAVDEEGASDTAQK
jgi:prolyl-tRNA editing enzyme YbaK/EbsC (Cys-tRNA(Pro) deacylase)